MYEFTNKEVRVRKKHRCSWCGEDINIGDAARYRTGKYQGELFSERKHLECYDAILRSDMGCDDEYYFGDQLRGKTYQESHDG